MNEWKYFLATEPIKNSFVAQRQAFRKKDLCVCVCVSVRERDSSGYLSDLPYNESN